MTDIFAQLAAPFPADSVRWRIGSTTGDKKKGMALAYIDSRDVMERLDTVVGPEKWQNKYPHATSKTCCEIGIKVDGEWIWKSDGAGDTDVEGSKGAFSDAFKRAAVQFGIGRYLYGLGNTWVEIEPAGKSFKIKKDQYPKLRASLPGNNPPVEKPPAANDAPLTKDEICTKLGACTSLDELVATWTEHAVRLNQMKQEAPDDYHACVEKKDGMKADPLIVGDTERTAIQGEAA